ncbi:MAG TPA: hypothetical protein PKY26_05590 [Acetivibrio clariflavus]|nr:hypothetical protein [Acetivibrio clariflavus]
MEGKTIQKFFSPVVFIVVLIFAIIFSSITIIPTGYTGVKTTFGQIDPKPLKSGPHFKIPFIQSIEKGASRC